MSTSPIDTSGARAKLIDVGRQVRFATAQAPTFTAKDAQCAVEACLPKVFDRPVSFKQRGIAIIPARRIWL